MSTAYDLTVSAIDQTYPLDYAGTVQTYGLNVGVTIETVAGEHYTGLTEVTPSQDVQILETQGLFTDDNIRINPIPSNYGLITWDGSILTVS